MISKKNLDSQSNDFLETFSLYSLQDNYDFIYKRNKKRKKKKNKINQFNEKIINNKIIKENKKNKENNKLKNNPNTILKKSRNSVNSQKDIFIKRDNNFSEENRHLNKKINNTEIFKETINYRNKNQLKQQDSIISFCDLKNYLDDKNTNTIQSSNDQEKEKLDKNIELNNSKLEEFMEQIKEKLSTINKFLTTKVEIKIRKKMKN